MVESQDRAVLNAADEEWLKRALDLAEQGRGRTAPNPMVGALVVKDGVLLGEGFHCQAGDDHAEMAALRAAAPGASPPDFAGLLRGVTVYVSLEPCAHYGRTPPCADLRWPPEWSVVVAAQDPSPRVCGKGWRACAMPGAGGTGRRRHWRDAPVGRMDRFEVVHHRTRS